MGTFEASVQHLVKVVPEFHPGDVFIYNDPYTGGTHQNDVKVIRPIFHGGEVFAFAIALCHWPDVGGPMHGTFNPHATECYAEGLRMPPLQALRERGPQQADLGPHRHEHPRPQRARGRALRPVPGGRAWSSAACSATSRSSASRRSATPSRTRWTTRSGCSASGSAGSPTARTSSPTGATATSAARTSPHQGPREADDRGRSGHDRLDGLRSGAGRVLGLRAPRAAVGHLRRDHALLPRAGAAQPRRRARDQHRLQEGHLRRRPGADAGHRLLLGRLREGRLRDDGVLGPGAPAASTRPACTPPP